MSTIAREAKHEAGRGAGHDAGAGVVSLHDHVVSLVAQRWARSFQCKVTIKPDVEQHGWAAGQHDPDIIGWQYSPAGNRVEWIAEVETEESLSQPLTSGRLQDQAALGVPFYLFVPKGYRPVAQRVATRAGIRLNGVYEYAFVNETFQLS
jgi:hypothetical protein